MLLDDVKINTNNVQQSQLKSNCILLHVLLPLMVDLVSDTMRRESAIAEDFWSSILKNNTNDRMEITLKTIEQK